MTIRHSLLIATLATLALPACESEEAKEKAREVGEQAKEMAKEAGEGAKEAGAKAKEVAKEVGAEAKEAGEKVKEAGEHLADEAAEKGKEMWAERKGELSDNAKDILAQGAASSAESVEAFVHKGTQVAPVAIDVAKTLHGVVDSDVDIEPIVQNLDDANAQAELDKRIDDMPRVETIDGVDVGFKEVTQWDTAGRGKESAYLILWRRDARLFGLVYRSKSRINVDKLVEEAPRLIRLVNGQVGVSEAEAGKLERRLLRQMSQLNRRFELIEPGDKIMVAISGGKDSWAMLHLLRAYERMLPFSYELVAVNLDQGHPGFPVERLREHLDAHGFAHRLVARDTYSVVKQHTKQGKAYCSLCSRLRRGILYEVAVELGATKIALGHHRDDVIETLLLNLFYAGQLKAMPAKLHSDDGRNVIIRPLAGCAEADIAAWVGLQGFPVVPCDLCGAQPDLKRAQVKQLLATLEQGNPLLRKNMSAAIGNVKPSHLWDSALWEALGGVALGAGVARGRDPFLDGGGDGGDDEDAAELAQLRVE